MVYNSKDFTILSPPIISRQMQIEESYKVNKKPGSCSIDKISKLYSDTMSDYIIKRNKATPLTHLNLESTMGLRRGRTKNISANALKTQ
jgi:hypothetical protein